MGAYSKLVSDLFDFDKQYEEPIVEDYIVGFSGINPSKKIDPSSIPHESLNGLLGGNASEHYHLTSAQVGQIQTNANNISKLNASVTTINTNINTLNTKVKDLSTKQNNAEEYLAALVTKVNTIDVKTEWLSKIVAVFVKMGFYIDEDGDIAQDEEKAIEYYNNFGDTIEIDGEVADDEEINDFLDDLFG